jgi:hypothetical protein
VTDFTISFDGAVTLTEDEIWPDGDAPENPTPLDAKRVMEAHGHKMRTLHDWGLTDDLAVYVETKGNGPYPVWLS